MWNVCSGRILFCQQLGGLIAPGNSDKQVVFVEGGYQPGSVHSDLMLFHCNLHSEQVQSVV